MKFKLYISFILFSLFAFSQTSLEEQSKVFIEYLINNNDKIVEYVDESELRISNCLGIQYEDVKHKFLISYDIDDNVNSTHKCKI